LKDSVFDPITYIAFDPIWKHSESFTHSNY